MNRSPQYMQGYRAAIKDAVTWLHERAGQMNDPHAKQVLNGAAWNLGHEKKPSATQAAKAAALEIWNGRHGT